MIRKMMKIIKINGMNMNGVNSMVVKRSFLLVMALFAVSTAAITMAVAKDANTYAALCRSAKNLRAMSERLKESGYDLVPCWLDANLVQKFAEDYVPDDNNLFKGLCRSIWNFACACKGKSNYKKIYKERNGSRYIHRAISGERAADGLVFFCWLDRQVLKELGAQDDDLLIGESQKFHIIVDKSSKNLLDLLKREVGLEPQDDDQPDTHLYPTPPEGVERPTDGHDEIPVRIILCDEGCGASRSRTGDRSDQFTQDKIDQICLSLDNVMKKADALKLSKETDSAFSIVNIKDPGVILEKYCNGEVIEMSGLRDSDEFNAFDALLVNAKEANFDVKIRCGQIATAAAIFDCTLVRLPEDSFYNMQDKFNNLEKRVGEFKTELQVL